MGRDTIEYMAVGFRGPSCCLCSRRRKQVPTWWALFLISDQMAGRETEGGGRGSAVSPSLACCLPSSSGWAVSFLPDDLRCLPRIEPCHWSVYRLESQHLGSGPRVAPRAGGGLWPLWGWNCLPEELASDQLGRPPGAPRAAAHPGRPSHSLCSWKLTGQLVPTQLDQLAPKTSV